MQKRRYLSLNQMAIKYILLLIFILTIPAFSRMIRPGIFSMQDFHLFRLYEFDLCFRDFQIPCRWARDAGRGYGEPVFNFYTQVPYAIGEIFHLIGFQFIDSIKILFILSLVGSAISMFFLAKQIWGNNLAGILSSIVYTYAPYRALDIWVRGALPESVAFVIFPIIILLINNIFSHKNLRDILLLSFFLSLLLLTHNLSFLMFLPFLVIWLAFLVFTTKKWKLIFPILCSFVFSGMLSAFYLLPVIFESRFVNLDLTTKGYFDFRGHFTTVYQLFVSRFWGYGASLFGPVDDISLSVGQIQWILPVIVLLGFLLKKKDWKKLIVLIFIGWFALFMSHNKSTVIWEKLQFLSYIQFPWRWLSIATFSFAICSGGSATLLNNRYKKIVVSGVILLTIFFNLQFFKEDIWYKIDDSEQFKGKRWEEQTSASLTDYWPVSARDLPIDSAPTTPVVLEGEGRGSLEAKSSKNYVYSVELESEKGKVQFPVAFFPGWKGKVDDKEIEVYPEGKYGLITTDLSKGNHLVFLNFTDTPIRISGNIISLVSIIALLSFYKILVKKKYVS